MQQWINVLELSMAGGRLSRICGAYLVDCSASNGPPYMMSFDVFGAGNTIIDHTIAVKDGIGRAHSLKLYGIIMVW
jgi:hypothetical protein